MVQRYDGKRLISSFQWHLTRNAPNQLRNVFLEVFLHFVWRISIYLLLLQKNHKVYEIPHWHPGFQDYSH